MIAGVLLNKQKDLFYKRDFVEGRWEKISFMIETRTEFPRENFRAFWRGNGEPPNFPIYLFIFVKINVKSVN